MRIEAETRIDDVAGLVVVKAGRQTLREWALRIGGLGEFWQHGESCAEPDWPEMRFCVHAQRHFDRYTAWTRQARAEVLAEGDLPADPELLTERIRTRYGVVADRSPGPWRMKNSGAPP